MLFRSNCVANGKLLGKGIFENIWIQPAAGDAGGALGAALYAFYQITGAERITKGSDQQKGSYLGPEFSEKEVKIYLDTNGYPYHSYTLREKNETLAKLLRDGKIIGLCNGRMEFGPRALGNRSIIGDARSIQTQSQMNLKIKYRESFRPFAPSVLLDDAEKYFLLEGHESPYMLLCVPVDENRRLPFDMKKFYPESGGLDLLPIVNIPRSDIPAITHVDYSARVQTVSKDTNPEYYDIIQAFKQLTGYGVIVNTSFNVRGEPIVCTPKDAYECFMRTEMDVLSFGNLILYKEEQPVFKEEIDWRERYALD